MAPNVFTLVYSLDVCGEMDNLTKLTAAGILIAGRIPDIGWAGAGPDIRPAEYPVHHYCLLWQPASYSWPPAIKFYRCSVDLLFFAA